MGKRQSKNRLDSWRTTGNDWNWTGRGNSSYCRIPFWFTVFI